MRNPIDDVPMDEAETKAVAGMAQEQANKAVNSYAKIRKELHIRLGEHPAGIVPPEYADIIQDDAYWQEIKDIHDIIEGYANMEFEARDTNHDVVLLSARVVRLSTLVGYSKGVASAAESQRKVIHARMHVAIREIAEDMNLKITESAAESMSRDESMEYADTAAYAITAHEILSSLYFAAMAFVRVLESSAQRKHHELTMSAGGRT